MRTIGDRIVVPMLVPMPDEGPLGLALGADNERARLAVPRVERIVLQRARLKGKAVCDIRVTDADLTTMPLQVFLPGARRPRFEPKRGA